MNDASLDYYLKLESSFKIKKKEEGMKRYTVKEIRKKVEKIEGEKSKTKKGLEEELVGIIEKIKNAGSSFEIAELSEEALNITEKIKEVRKRQESRFESEPEPKDTEILLLGDIVLCD